MPILSIIIPTKNEESSLPRFLRSARAQTFRSFEIIVADAKSTDQTRKIAEQEVACVIEGGLPARGRNRGADIARGEWLGFFDADVQFPHEMFLEQCLEALEQNRFDVATCLLLPESSRWTDVFMHKVYNRYLVLSAPWIAHAPGSCIFVRKSVHDAVRGFDETVVFAEDMEYVQRIQKQGFLFGVIPDGEIIVSVRRMEKDGRWQTAIKYLWTEMHMLIRGPYRMQTPFQYEFGYRKEEQTKEEK